MKNLVYHTKIKERLNLWENRNSNEKNIFLTKYNIREWSNISYEDKSKHALYITQNAWQKTFPIKTNAGKRKAKSNGWRENKQKNKNEKKKKKEKLAEAFKILKEYDG